jgi:hypothetical protein
MAMEKKKKSFEEIMFAKRWAKRMKLMPSFHLLKSTVGKAPACNTNTAKKEVTLQVASKKKK